MKSVNYIIRPILFINLLFLFSACRKNVKTDGQENPSTKFSFISIDYTLLKVSPQKVLSTKKYWVNQSDRETSFSSIGAQVLFISFFSMPDENLEGFEHIRQIEVPLPKLDAEGIITGLSDMALPLAFKDSSAEMIDLQYACSAIVPAFSTYIFSAYNIGWNVSTQFTCTIKNDNTQKLIMLKGEWRGNVYYRQDIYVADNQNNIIKQEKYRILY